MSGRAVSTLAITGYRDPHLDAGGLGTVAYQGGTFGPASPQPAPADPSWVVGTPPARADDADHGWWYVVGEHEQGVVRAVGRRGQAGQEASSGGDAPCHLARSPDGARLVVCNYTSGTVGLLRVDAGRLELLDVLRLQGSGPHDRQDASHAHQAVFLSDVEVAVCDLGSDRVVGLRLGPDRAAGREPRHHRLRPTWEAHLPPGSGPRHLALSADGAHAWVVGELDCTVHTLRLAPTGWAHHATCSTVPPGIPLGDSWAAAIVAAGSSVYVTTRGADLLTRFAVREDGSLQLASSVPTLAWPRYAGWLPDGSLAVGAERADTVQVFALGSGGDPHPTGVRLPWPRPTCLAW